MGEDVEEGGGAQGLHIVGVGNGGEMEEDGSEREVRVGVGRSRWWRERRQKAEEEWACRGIGGRGTGRVRREERGGGVVGLGEEEEEGGEAKRRGRGETPSFLGAT
ncbi:hypothetical protein AAC387_Pa07g0038 [Persea americana]